LTKEQLESAYTVLRENMSVIEEPELKLDQIREALEGVFSDWDGVKWPAGLLDSIRAM